jgi:hypothetical protein
VDGPTVTVTGSEGCLLASLSGLGAIRRKRTRGLWGGRSLRGRRWPTAGYGPGVAATKRPMRDDADAAGRILLDRGCPRRGPGGLLGEAQTLHPRNDACLCEVLPECGGRGAGLVRRQPGRVARPGRAVGAVPESIPGAAAAGTGASFTGLRSEPRGNRSPCRVGVVAAHHLMRVYVRVPRLSMDSGDNSALSGWMPAGALGQGCSWSLRWAAGSLRP